MPGVTIEGKISSTGYLHVRYDTQTVDGKLYTPYDIVITPRDENGTVSFTLPQGINVRIDSYRERNGPKEMEIAATIPKVERIAFSLTY
jgi:hypothetical protein